MRSATIIVVALSLNVCSQASAEVSTSADDHFSLRHESTSDMAPDQLWGRLVVPATWWSSEHTYSGDSKNLSLDVRAGGYWLEEWSGGSVLHGQVAYVAPFKQLRLDAPFGPLKSMAVECVWTISIEPDGKGSLVVFEFVANGSSRSDLATIAPSVDYVFGEAMSRLTTNSIE